MHSVKEQYRDINPVTVSVIEANVTSSLYCGAVHGLDAPGADLVEAFLVELYRCRVCQFTSSLKSSIKTHLLDSHDDLPPAMASSGFEEEEEAAVMEEHHAPPRAPDSPYHLEHELTSESKHSDDDPMDHMGLDRMAFLLPMYGILPSISPRSCDMGLSSNCEGGLQVAETCEVSTLFEDQDDEEEERADGEDAAIFTLKACPDGACPEPLSCPLARPPNQLDEQLAQSAHLMTLGLCRISRTPKVSAPPAPQRPSPPDSKESPPPPSDLPGDRQGAAAAETPASRVCRRCGKRMRRQGRTKSCRACQHAARNRRSRDARAPDGRSPDPRTANAHDRLTAAEHDAHAASARRASAGSRTASHKRADRTRKDRTGHTRTGGTHTPDTQACSHEAWLNCDTPPPSHQPIRGRGHNGTDSAHPPRTRKRKGSPERNMRRKTNGPPGGAGQSEVCCLLCNRKFSSRLTLRRHMGIHQGSKPYSCQLCPYRSRLKASLMQHNRIHTGEKPYQCPHPGCSYASIDRSSLLRHSRTHTQQRPYHCPHCPYSCIQKKSLDLHARRHHTGESFPCQQCPYSSPDRQLLLRHVRRHHQPVAASP